MCESVVESEFEVEWQYLVCCTVFIGIEAFDLPSYVTENESHLEGRVLGLEMSSNVSSDGERVVGFVDGIDRFDCDADGEIGA